MVSGTFFRQLRNDFLGSPTLLDNVVGGYHRPRTTRTVQAVLQDSFWAVPQQAQALFKILFVEFSGNDRVMDPLQPRPLRFFVIALVFAQVQHTTNSLLPQANKSFTARLPGSVEFRRNLVNVLHPRETTAAFSTTDVAGGMHKGTVEPSTSLTCSGRVAKCLILSSVQCGRVAGLNHPAHTIASLWHSLPRLLARQRSLVMGGRKPSLYDVSNLLFPLVLRSHVNTGCYAKARTPT